MKNLEELTEIVKDLTEVVKDLTETVLQLTETGKLNVKLFQMLNDRIK